MTIYEKNLISVIETRFAELNPAQLIEKLIEMGVVDYTRCKILAVREFVNEALKIGGSKTDAMWSAAEKFACSYEYVRKCMYYYCDVNIC